MALWKPTHRDAEDLERCLRELEFERDMLEQLSETFPDLEWDVASPTIDSPKKHKFRGRASKLIISRHAWELTVAVNIYLAADGEIRETIAYPYMTLAVSDNKIRVPQVSGVCPLDVTRAALKRFWDNQTMNFSTQIDLGRQCIDAIESAFEQRVGIPEDD